MNDKFEPKVDAMFADPSGTEYQIMEERDGLGSFLSQKSAKNRMEYKVRILKRGEKMLSGAKVGEERWVQRSTFDAMELKTL